MIESAATREEWMMRCVEIARPLFAEQDALLPSVRVSLAPPHQNKMRAIGLCWHPGTCADDAREVWVSSALDEPLKVAATLVHELCHACLPGEEGHGRNFKKLATAMGLAGKATATYGSEEFNEAWTEHLKAAGPMPGAAFTSVGMIVGKRKPQKSTPKKNVTCPVCGFFAKVRVDQMHIGRLRCPADDEMLLTAEEGGE